MACITFMTPKGTILEAKPHSGLEGTYAEILSINPFNNILTGDQFEVTLIYDNGVIKCFGLNFTDAMFSIV